MSKGNFPRDYGRSLAVLPVDQWTEETERKIQGKPEIRVNLLEGYDKVDFRVDGTFLKMSLRIYCGDRGWKNHRAVNLFTAYY